MSFAKFLEHLFYITPPGDFFWMILHFVIIDPTANVNPNELILKT